MLVTCALVATGCGGDDEPAAQNTPTGPAIAQTVPAEGQVAGNESSVDKTIAGDLERNLAPHRATQYGNRVFDVRVGGAVARIFTTLPRKNERTRQYASYICAAAYGPKGKEGIPGLRELHVVLRGGRHALACDDLKLPAPAS